MSVAHKRIALAAAALLAFSATPSLAQRISPEQHQIIQLQQQLAASQAASFRLEQRLQAIERQLQQIVNRSEQNGHRVNQLESAIQQLRNEQDSRIAALERAAAAPPPQVPAVAAEEAAPTELQPARESAASPTPAKATTTSANAESDPGEDAYTVGFKLWEAGEYDRAITALRAFTAAFPTHRRVSWANNLAGRALLDKGQPRAAAEVLLANYRKNPKGGRAQDSLYYLGQSLMKLGQPSQACKAYAELTSVYGDSVRGELRPLIAKARADANCS